MSDDNTISPPAEPAGMEHNILADIVASVREDLFRRKAMNSLTAIQRACEHQPVPGQRPFRNALRQKGLNIIAEIKKSSPSTGPFPPTISILQRAHEYWQGGAAAISVVTEPRFFSGSLDILREIRPKIPLPILRKDFIIDAYQVYESRLAGADALLLIASILENSLLKDLIQLTESLGLDTLVEVTTAEEIERATRCGARIIGVNNRNLKNLSTDYHRSLELARAFPANILHISESGLSAKEQLQELSVAGYNGFLMGDSLMRKKDPKAYLQQLLGVA